jgi:iron complex outermembrane recepter protein
MYSGFVQDQIVLVPNRLSLIAGAKLDHNYYTGFGLMPTIRLAWTPTAHQTVWGGVSRALQTPTEIDASIRLNVASFTGMGGTPVLVAVLGNPSLKDQVEIAYEAGYRAFFGERFSVDIAGHFNDESQQETAETGTPFPEATPLPAHLVLPTVYENLMHGGAYGLELAANWKVSSRWTLSPGYAYEGSKFSLDPSSNDTTSVAAAEGGVPANSAQLRSHVDLPRRFAWDLSGYFVDRLVDPAIPSYTRLDTGITWQWGERSSFSVAGQNLLQNEHLEYVDLSRSTLSSLVKRGVYAKVTWCFR